MSTCFPDDDAIRKSRRVAAPGAAAALLEQFSPCRSAYL